MKLLKLNIHNIASIEDAVINFDEQPLAASEVFLITGKTGSGKSTILDAISLALYGNTPRLKNTLMQGNSPNDEKVKINNPVQLMRRGTGESWVKLSFLGNTGLHYEAQWSVARARKKEWGKIQPKNWSLHIVEQNSTLYKDNEISSEINKAIGLDFNQFCRTTMLAQGEFTKFLNSKDDEKSSILEKITGVNIYSRIGSKVFEITTSKKAAYQQADDKISQVEILSAEEVEELEKQLKELGSNNSSLADLLKTLDIKKKWLQDLATKSKQVEIAEAESQEIELKIKSDVFKEQDSLVNDWNATTEARTWLNEKKVANRTKTSLEQEMKQHQSTFTMLKEGLMALDNDINQETLALSDDNINISSQDDKKEIYANWLAINEKLNNLVQCNNRIKDENITLKKSNDLLNGKLKTAKEKAETEHNEKEEAVKTSQDNQAKLEKELEACHIADLRSKQDELNNKRHNIDTANLMLENRDKFKQQVDQKDEALKLIERTINELTSDLEGFEKDRQEATIAHESKRTMHDKLREGVEQWAKNMRSKLQVGDKCPVCQQHITIALPHEEEIDSIFAQAENELKDAEKTLKEATAKCDKCEANIKAQGEQKKRAEKELKTANDNLVAQEEKTIEACNKCGIDCVDDNTSQRLVSMVELMDKEIGEVKEKLDKAQETDDAVNKARKAYNTARNQLEEAKQKLHKAETDITNCKNKIDTSNRVISDNKKQIDELSQDISRKLAATQWKNNWETETTEFALELKQAAESYNNLVEDCKKRQNKLEQNKKEFNLVKEALDAIVADVPQWINVSPTIASEVKELLTTANNLRTQVVATQQQIINVSNREKELERLINVFVEQHPSLSINRITALTAISQNDFAKTQHLVQETRNKVIACEAAVKLKKGELEAHNNQKPDLDDDDTAQSLSAKINDINTEMMKLSQEMGAMKQRLETDKLNKKRLEINGLRCIHIILCV